MSMFNFGSCNPSPIHRQAGESQQQYKERRRRERQAAANRPVKALWYSGWGTYVRRVHGPLGIERDARGRPVEPSQTKQRPA